MRRKHRAASADSLDLLLDTITNTFGGILLVAILLVLLVRNTTAPVEGVQGSNLVSLEQATVYRDQIAVLETRLQVLTQTLEQQQQMERNFSDPIATDLANALRELLKQQNALRGIEQDLREKNRQLSERLVNLESQKVSGKEDAIALAAVLAAAQSELKNEQDFRTRTMDLPKEEFTSKSMMVAFAKENQLYLPDAGLGGPNFQLNTHQFEKCSVADADLVLADLTAVRIKAGNGHSIDKTTIQTVLSRYSSDRYYLTLVCAPDTFENFSILRETLVELGFEHRIMPHVSPPPVYETRGSGRAKAQ